MPIARIGKTILFFAHIPKTGGSSIETYLAARGQVCLLSKHPTGFSRVTPQHMECETFDRYIPRQFYDHGFAILRDPVERLQSEFRHQLRLAKKPGRLLSALVPVKSGQHPLERKADRFLRRGDFDGWVTLVLSACALDPYVFDAHIRPQFDFVHPEHRLFDLGSGLGPVIRWIEQVAEISPLPVSPPHEKLSPKIPIAISKTTENKVRQFYSADFELLENLRHPAGICA